MATERPPTFDRPPETGDVAHVRNHRDHPIAAIEGMGDIVNVNADFLVALAASLRALERRVAELEAQRP